jgi:hypothetical protein
MAKHSTAFPTGTAIDAQQVACVYADTKIPTQQRQRVPEIGEVPLFVNSAAAIKVFLNDGDEEADFIMQVQGRMGKVHFLFFCRV